MFNKENRETTALAKLTIELQASERRLRDIVSQSLDGIVIVDSRGSIRFVNPAAETIFRRKGKDLLGEQFGFPIVEGETTELDIVRKGAAMAVVEMRVAGIEWEGEAAFLATLRDITERRRAEKELRKLYLAISESPSIVMITDTLGNIEFVNPKFTKITGYTMAEVAGRNARILQSGKIPSELYRNLWETITSGKEWHGEFINKKKNGELYYESASIAPVVGFDGEITNFVAVKEDITERKLGDDALRESEALLRVIFDQASQLMGLMKPDGTLLRMNQTAASFIEKDESEVLGKPFWETPWWSHSSDQRERLREAVKAAAGGEFVRFEATHPTPDGNLVWVDFSLKPVLDHNGAVMYLIPEGRDITPQKQAKEQIEILNTELAIRNTELESANQELEAFNYTVSHDLRVPLSVISGYTQLIQQVSGDTMGENCKGYLPEISKAVSRMTSLIDSLLNFSRVMRVELRRESVDLTAVAKEVVAELVQVSPERRPAVTIAEGMEASGDRNLLRVALGNILSNAWKYTSEQKEAVIEFGVTEVGEEKVYFVRDNGPGFDMADAEKLFIPFQRLVGEGDFAGHGIGLATVEKIIRRHCGRIWAEGAPGKGATFYFTLPDPSGHSA